MSAGANMGHGASTALNAAAQPVKYPFTIDKVVLEDFSLTRALDNDMCVARAIIKSIDSMSDPQIKEHVEGCKIDVTLMVPFQKLPKSKPLFDQPKILPIKLPAIKIMSKSGDTFAGEMTGLLLKNVTVKKINVLATTSGSIIKCKIDYIDETPLMNDAFSLLAIGRTVSISTRLPPSSIMDTHVFPRLFIECPCSPYVEWKAQEQAINHGHGAFITSGVRSDVMQITRDIALSDFK